MYVRFKHLHKTLIIIYKILKLFIMFLFKNHKDYFYYFHICVEKKLI